MKNNKTLFLLTLLTIAVIVYLGIYIIYSRAGGDAPTVTDTTRPQGQLDPKNSTFVIGDQTITLKSGLHEIESAPGSASKTTTRYFGNEIKNDLDGDGTQDIAFLVTQSTGGTGTFYYVVGILNTSTGPIGSKGLLLGDRIAPQSTNLLPNSTNSKIIVVNYADRKTGEDFSVSPSVGKSLWLLLDTQTMQFGEVVQNFEGEADVSKMNLTMKPWTWIQTSSANGSTPPVKPRQADRFVLTFKSDKTFSASTDCNGVGGEYSTNGSKITFERMMSTLMYCENSQESEFSKMISEAQSYKFTSKGELILTLKNNGTMIFK